MKAKQDPISEFTSLMNQLRQAPENITLKQALLKRLPVMKALAAHNPMALYRLAQSYSDNSPQYRQMMLRAADMGCTNALLDACKLLMRAHDSVNRTQVLSYLKSIAASEDSFIKHKTADWLTQHPEIQRQLSASASRNIERTTVRFFNVLSCETDDTLRSASIPVIP